MTIGRSELDQVEDYANVLTSNPQFASSTAQWDLILVGTKLDDVATNRINNDGAELGKFWGPKYPAGGPRVTAYVRRCPVRPRPTERINKLGTHPVDRASRPAPSSNPQVYGHYQNSC